MSGERGERTSQPNEEAVDRARIILQNIAADIRSLEGFPVDFGLARQLSALLKRIEESV